MWTTAEIIAKDPTKGGYVISVLFSTDNKVPLTETGSIFLGPGQAAIVQQLADLNATDAQQAQLDDLKVTVDAIPLGIVDLKAIAVPPALGINP